MGCEAELMGIVRASSEAIGITQLAAGWGLSIEAQVWTDSSAALAVSTRKGCGKLRHVKIGDLWIQEKAASGEIRYRKVPGAGNPADLMTKYLTGGRIFDLLELIQLQSRAFVVSPRKFD